MRKTQLFCFFMALLFCLFSYPVYAVDSPAYKKLIYEEPVYTMDVTVQELLDYYSNAETDEILDLKENNYTYGEVAVGGVKKECHVYMRTFSITDISDHSAEEVRTLADSIFTEVKASLSSKYIKCIARSYSINVSGVPDKNSGGYKSFTVKFLIATGESNEERQQVINELVRPAVAQWEGLDISQKLIKLNEFLLSGQFTYDVSQINRSSVYAFVTEKKGVCEEYSGLTALFLDELGLENSIITGKTDGLTHMWNLVTVHGRVYHLDILHNGPIDENGVHVEITREYLLVSTEYILQSRTPNEQYEKYYKDAVYNYVFEGIPDEIPKDIFEVKDGVMSQIPLYTSVSSLIEELTEGGGFLYVTSADGTPLAEDALVGSGCVLTLEANGVKKEALTLHVMGDINGDGMLSSDDLEIISSVILRRDEEATSSYKRFCDINGDGAVTVTDFLSFSVLGGTISL